MDQILTGITALFASIFAIFSLGGQPAATIVTPTPTQIVSQAPTNNTQNVIFKGVSPCADCSGINIVLTLNYDGTTDTSGTYTESFAYQGKPQGNYTNTGTWTGLPNDVIELTSSDANSSKEYYLQTHPDTLVALDQNQQKIPSPGGYTLTSGQ